MSKTKRKHIYLDFTHPDALRAQDIPYDSTESVKQAIDRATAGLTGPQGETGLYGSQGVTGIQGLGETGLQGVTGLIGITGAYGGPQGDTGLIGPIGFQGETGIQGYTGLGVTGLQGITGLNGSQGITGIQGLSGDQGLTGLRGFTGLSGLGATGLQGPTGFQGATGISSANISYNPINRYGVVNTTGEEVWLVSSSVVYTGIAWSRDTTVLTISRNNHGHITGDRVIVRNTNVDYQTNIITTYTTNNFVVDTINSGIASGNNGAYSMGFTYAHNGSPKTGGTVYSPSGDHADTQLLSMRIRTGTRSGTVYDVIVPASSINGAGDNTGLSNCFIPDFSVRVDSDSLAAVAGTIATNISGSYTTFEIGNLGTASLSRFIILHF